ncbi:acyl carrier protein [Streptomyces sp. NPDC001093]|uniref:acyl carrier protein n=1 Tax=Streptomyces sp. NPDC001093 TaxID=3154376 RepID=UPI0033339896
MSGFTVLELKDTMLSIAEEIGLDLEGDFLDKPFTDLAFDSLAVLELVTHIQQDFHLAISDDAVADFTTPRDVLDYVNRQLHESVR